MLKNTLDDGCIMKCVILTGHLEHNHKEYSYKVTVAVLRTRKISA